MECVILVVVLSPLVGGITGGSPVRDSNLAPAANLAQADSVSDEPASAFADLNAHQAVRAGNRRLIDGNPTDALGAYRHAEKLVRDSNLARAPDEIAFVQGLAHYELKEFDQAREAFQRAATSTNDSLTDDALYSLSTCDHAEALESLDSPELALSMLESAMRQYHNVLANRPDHEAARDANLKAASMWRELKEQLQQQQQQQDQGQRQEDQQQPDPTDQAQEQQQQQQESRTGQQERVSREQAERKLRELMQAIRERKKMRRDTVQTILVKPVDKDW